MNISSPNKHTDMLLSLVENRLLEKLSITMSNKKSSKTTTIFVTTSKILEEKKEN